MGKDNYKSNRAKYEPIVRETAKKYGIDPDIFVRQINQESSFNPNAKSDAGAIGIGQFMPDTAKGMGVNPYDPISSIDGAARYMKGKLKQFGGDYIQAIASYNGGDEAAAYFKEHPEVLNKPFMTKKFGKRSYSWETAHYINTILGKSTPTAKNKKSNSTADAIDTMSADFNAKSSANLANIANITQGLTQKSQSSYVPTQADYERAIQYKEQYLKANPFISNNIVPEKSGENILSSLMSIANNAGKSISSSANWAGDTLKRFVEDPNSAVVHAIMETVVNRDKIINNIGEGAKLGLSFAGSLAGGAMVGASGGTGLPLAMGVAGGASYLGDYVKSLITKKDIEADHVGAVMNAASIGVFGLGTKALTNASIASSPLKKYGISYLTGANVEGASLFNSVASNAVSNMLPSYAVTKATGNDYTPEQALVDLGIGAAVDLGFGLIQKSHTNAIDGYTNAKGSNVINPTHALSDVGTQRELLNAQRGQETLKKTPEIATMSKETLESTYEQARQRQVSFSILADDEGVVSNLKSLKTAQNKLDIANQKLQALPPESKAYLNIEKEVNALNKRLEKVNGNISKTYLEKYGIPAEAHATLLDTHLANLDKLNTEAGRADVIKAMTEAKVTADDLDTIRSGNASMERLAISEVAHQNPKILNDNPIVRQAFNINDNNLQALNDRVAQGIHSDGFTEVVLQANSLRALSTAKQGNLENYLIGIDENHPLHTKKKHTWSSYRGLVRDYTLTAEKALSGDVNALADMKYFRKGESPELTDEQWNTRRLGRLIAQAKELDGVERLVKNDFQPQVIADADIPVLKEALGDTFNIKPIGDGFSRFTWNDFNPEAPTIKNLSSIEKSVQGTLDLALDSVAIKSAHLEADTAPHVKEVAEYDLANEVTIREGYDDLNKLGGDPTQTFLEEVKEANTPKVDKTPQVAQALSKVTGLNVTPKGEVKLNGKLGHKQVKSWFGVRQNAIDFAEDLFHKFDPQSIDPLTGHFVGFQEHFTYNEMLHKKVVNAVTQNFDNFKSVTDFDKLKPAQKDALAYAKAYQMANIALLQRHNVHMELGISINHMKSRALLKAEWGKKYAEYGKDINILKKDLGDMKSLPATLETITSNTPNHTFFKGFAENLNNVNIYSEMANLTPLERFQVRLNAKITNDIYLNNYQKPTLELMHNLGIIKFESNMGEMGALSRGVTHALNSTVLTSTPINSFQAYSEGAGNLRLTEIDLADLHEINPQSDLNGMSKKFLSDKGYDLDKNVFMSSLMGKNLLKGEVRTAVDLPELAKLSERKFGKFAKFGETAFSKPADFINGMPFRFAHTALDREMAQASARITQGIMEKGGHTSIDIYEQIFDSVMASLKVKSNNATRSLITSHLVGLDLGNVVDLPTIAKTVDNVIEASEGWFKKHEANPSSFVGGSAMIGREAFSFVARGAETAGFQFSGFIGESARKHSLYLSDLARLAKNGKLTPKQIIKEGLFGAGFVGVFGLSGTMIGGSLLSLVKIANAMTMEDGEEGKFEELKTSIEDFNMYTSLMGDKWVSTAKLSLDQLDNSSMVINNVLAITQILPNVFAGKWDKGILGSRLKDIQNLGLSISDLFLNENKSEAWSNFFESLAKIPYTGLTSNIKTATAYTQGYTKITGTKTLYDHLSGNDFTSPMMTGEEYDKMSENFMYNTYKLGSAMIGLRARDLAAEQEKWQTDTALAVKRGDLLGALGSFTKEAFKPTKQE